MDFNTREQWLNAAAAILLDEVIEPVIHRPTPLMRYSLTAPKTHLKSTKVLGECWAKEASEDNHHEIFLTANLGNVDSVLILATTLHEILHAYDDLKNGHKQPFIDLCKRVGLEGGRTPKAACSFTATIPSAALTVILQDIVDTIGPIPHGALNARKSGKPTQTNRQKLVYCTDTMDNGCSFKFRASQKAIDSMVSMQCPCCLDVTLTQEIN